MRWHCDTGVRGIRRAMFLGLLLISTVAVGYAANQSVHNLGLSAQGGMARSWETGVTVIPEHEPFRANDGSFRTYWAIRAQELPADLGLEWPQAQ